MNAGKLKERITVNSYNNISDNYEWLESFKVWGSEESLNKRSIFSTKGISSMSGSKFITRYANITRNNSLTFKNEHYLIVSLRDIDNKHLFLEIEALKIMPIQCECNRYIISIDSMNRPSKELSYIYSFTGYITEKYYKYDDKEVNANIEHELILLTPKEIELKIADLVTIKGEKYSVQSTYVYNEYLNEYEITIKKDV